MMARETPRREYTGQCEDAVELQLIIAFKRVNKRHSPMVLGTRYDPSGDKVPRHAWISTCSMIQTNIHNTNYMFSWGLTDKG